VPAGLGAPVYAKIDTDIATGLMSINAVKGVEIGAGMDAASLTGVENADEIFMGNDGTIDKSGAETEIITKGRHDPCVGIRAVPVGEAMVACTILDHVLLHRAHVGENQGTIG